MSTQPQEPGFSLTDIELAFKETGWRSPDDGWFAYRLVGGLRKRDAYRDWVTSEREPRISDYAYLAYSINRKLEAEGKKAMLAEVPLPSSGDNGISSTLPSSPFPGYRMPAAA